MCRLVLHAKRRHPEGMMTSAPLSLTAIGLGYCARHLVVSRPGLFAPVVGTARSAEKLADMPDGVQPLLFDSETLAPELVQALSHTDILLVSAPPDERGDPVLRVAGEVLARAQVKQVVYLTTLGVYGDHQGGWVDETGPTHGESPRLQRRLDAEAAWLAFGETQKIPVAVLRLAGIYGPGRNVLAQLRAGTARIIDKPGQVFNRIHVEDVARAIVAVVAQRFSGLLNVTDDLPAASGEPIRFGAELLGVAQPLAVPFDEAAKAMNPMALSFWASSKRVSNTRLTKELGVELAYPTYQQGLKALAEAGEGA
ncbi:SDR family oxidoreductase [Xanthobacter sp. TB0139]|uniref:SDR family oxidoreductase n=1 Tax=Xanthobacter sp. TB0139 TaxID=3459178 RepID=UPI004039162C